ncbi:amidohydrolase family protein [Salipaludibacillus daqingensis]|uniref:amidohydrolase family protein n=1 Tax=Salipaludibacillus daqingensis TaxID=3041001 RepID=UPI0024733C33|nr:amidohydrolase family protein [Salipaludibacillus daqingensis]
MLVNTYQIRYVAIGLIVAVLIFTGLTFLSDDTETGSNTNTNIDGNQNSEQNTLNQDHELDPLIVSGFEDIIPVSADIIDLAVNGEKVAFLSKDDQGSNFKLSVGNIANEMEEITVIDDFSNSDEGSTPSITWDPETNQVVMNVKENGTWQLVTYDVDSGEKEELHTFDEEMISNVSVTAFENQWFYAQLLPSDPTKTTVRMNNSSFDAPMDIFQVDGMNENELMIEEVAVSPDRNHYAFTMYEEGEEEQQLWLYDSTENSKQRISSEGKHAGEASWSKDGQLLAYTESVQDEGKAIATYHVTNDEQWMVTEESGQSYAPDWTNDNELIFASETNDDLQLFKIDFQEAFGSELTSEEEATEEHSSYDVVILDGIVVDPETETFKFGYNVGVNGGEIAAITNEDIEGEETIDAEGNIVTPGFIDILSFNPNGGGEHFKVMDGVTTHLGMHGAGIEFQSMFDNLENRGMINHFGGAIQHSHMRTKLNLGPHDEVNEEQIEQMREMTHRSAREGAIGISFSPEYYPGTTPEEITAIMEVGKEYDLVSFFHVRYSTMFAEKTNIDALEEVIGYARDLDAPVQVQHINSTGGTFSMEQSIGMIDDAREEGLDITIDLYPYDYWATWANTARFDSGFLERFQLDYSDLQVANTEERLTEETFNQYRSERTLLIAYGIPEDDVKNAMLPDYAMIGSDTIMVPPDYNNHPRGSGTFSRTYRKYVKENETIHFMKALQMMTTLSAERLENVAHALQTKARFQVGMDADINILDYEKLTDTASPENVASFSEGVDYVLINGQIVKEKEGLKKNVLPGEVIRSDFD